jgi:hypothetical protein
LATSGSVPAPPGGDRMARPSDERAVGLARASFDRPPIAIL